MVDSVQCTILKPFNNVFFVKDPSNNEYSIYLNNGYLLAPPGVYFAGDLSVTAWVNVKQIRTYSRLFDFGNGESENNVLISLSDFSTGIPLFETFSNTRIRTRIKSPKKLELNKWNHIAVVIKGNLSLIYMDGIVVANGLLNIPFNVVRINNYIGKSNWASDQLADVLIKNFRIYNRALESAQVLKEMVNNVSSSS